MSHFRRRTSPLNLNNFRRIALLSALLAVLVASVWLLYSPSSPADFSRQSGSQWTGRNWDTDRSALADGSSGAFHAAEPRLIYPYSVIPGGVRSLEELRSVTARDAVVRDHYARLDFRKARMVSVRRPRMVYLSYRIGDKIYWTKKKVHLHRGEQLITDGNITVRTRCGNRVSSLPQKYGFSPQPSAFLFDKPIAPGSSTEIPFPPNFQSALESRPNLTGWGPPLVAPVGSGAIAANGSSPVGSGYPPIGSPLVPVYSCGKIGNGVCGSGPPVTTRGGPSTPVPEPATDELICAEILAAILAWRLASKKEA